MNTEIPELAIYLDFSEPILRSTEMTGYVADAVKYVPAYTLPDEEANVFEEILKERKKYEANRKRRINDKNNPFYDGDYICCSTYGKPRSKAFHFKYYKKLLQENNLPDIRWHDLRSTFCTLLIKNNYSPKAISKLMGHAKEIITLDIYGDNAQIIADGAEEIQPFMNEVMPKKIDLHEYLCDTEVNMDMLIGA